MFCDCKPLQKATLSLMKILLALIKKRRRTRRASRRNIEKSRKVNKLRQKLFDQG